MMFDDNKETDLISTNLAPGQLKNRDLVKKLLGTHKEKQILRPQTDFYRFLAKNCIENVCSVDLFLLSNQYHDVATLSDLVRKISGQIYKYEFLMTDTHGKRL